MSADDKIKTFKANEAGEYALPFSVSNPDDLRVFVSEADREGELLNGSGFTLVSRGNDELSIQTLKAVSGWVTIACVPCPDLNLRKQGPQMIADINSAFERMVQRMAYLEARIGKSISVPIGFPTVPQLEDNRSAHIYSRRDVKLHPDTPIHDYGAWASYERTPETELVFPYVQFQPEDDLADVSRCYVQFSRSDDCMIEFAPWVREEPKPTWQKTVDACDYGTWTPKQMNLSVKGCCDAPE